MKKIGVLTSGGDAPGMNAVIRAVTRAAISKGMEVVGVRRGYNGLISGDIIPLDARSVSDIIQRGGTMLYTARCAEFRYEEGLQKAKKTCEENGIEGLVVVGGDGSFRGAADLSARGILSIGVPGTIDNDISMTEYTIGYDTAMNTVVEMVMGRNAGYIALNAGIACGATYIITKEEPFTVNDVISKIIEGQKSGKHHFIVIVAEGIGGSEQLAKEIEQATGVESRATILGHVQRGGSPTVQDRVAASQLGL